LLIEGYVSAATAKDRFASRYKKNPLISVFYCEMYWVGLFYTFCVYLTRQFYPCTQLNSFRLHLHL